jgi:hypothetical protein
MAIDFESSARHIQLDLVLRLANSVVFSINCVICDSSTCISVYRSPIRVLMNSFISASAYCAFVLRVRITSTFIFETVLPVFAWWEPLPG